MPSLQLSLIRPDDDLNDDGFYIGQAVKYDGAGIMSTYWTTTPTDSTWSLKKGDLCLVTDINVKDYHPFIKARHMKSGNTLKILKADCIPVNI